MAAHSSHILVADDDPDLRDILRSILEPAGFAVSEAMDGRSALLTIRGQPPDLVILDYLMPGLTGPEVCAELKQDLLLRHLPIIMLTGKSDVQDKVHGINAGADDYLIKPFEPQELLARVKMVLRRTSQDLEANPLTRLPGNVTIQRELEHRLAAGGPLAVCYLDLNRFKAFNDHYGFKRGDEVIKRTAKILLEASRAEGSPNDFLGHIGGDDFILITTVDCASRLCEAIIRNFDAMVPALYDEADRTRGYMLHTDRKGQPVKTPLLSISIALVTNEERALSHPGQIAERGAELKAYAKTLERSVYVRERRKAPDK
jgi:PleD family two-component response regulator